MPDTTILLPPVLFDALHLSALEYGGMGYGAWTLNGEPFCPHGHAQLLDPSFPNALREEYGLGWNRNDVRMAHADLPMSQRVPFAKWCEVVGVDVRDA